MIRRADRETTINELASVFKEIIAEEIKNYEETNGFSPWRIYVVTYLSQEEYRKAIPEGFCRDGSWYNFAVDSAVSEFRPENRPGSSAVQYLMPYEVARAKTEPNAIYIDLISAAAEKLCS